ncbi:hypothetical protein BGZ65_012052 [Modicella reniformis]|uniref:NACHT domain-containing protein n=1 Tax=Modicella reniformis TaxID=1440133 RepID=A0A9P6M1D0_9FUNG|nr:hypothetical protein BGZ65_012052 [Modicella reniformis]
MPRVYSTGFSDYEDVALSIAEDILASNKVLSPMDDDAKKLISMLALKTAKRINKFADEIIAGGEVSLFLELVSMLSKKNYQAEEASSEQDCDVLRSRGRSARMRKQHRKVFRQEKFNVVGETDRGRRVELLLFSGDLELLNSEAKFDESGVACECQYDKNLRINRAIWNAVRRRGLRMSTMHPLDIRAGCRNQRKQRLKKHGDSVYIHPQAKVSLQSPDGERFALKEKVKKFLGSNQKVFLLLGDSGAGKSTFNRHLECDLWQSYKTNGCVPLHINLPAIDKPERDMVAKQLRKAEFTEPEIRELKIHRKFILICDGYDESQQTHNLYVTNRLNQPGEWNSQMIISCHSECLRVDYRDRNSQSDSSLFQEAAILRSLRISSKTSINM